MKTIAIIGMGYVGKAVHELFSHRSDIYEILTYDPASGDALSILEEQKEAINRRADLAIVCVPTPMSDNGECDLSAIKETFRWLETKLVLIKSTVLPGTTGNLQYNRQEQQLVFSPEYIGEGKYHVDAERYPHPTEMILHKFQIFGGAKDACAMVIQFFSPIMGPSVEYCITDSTTAELVKYGVNSWAAMKVTFFNELFDIAEKSGVQFEELRQLMLKDGRIEPMHTMVFADRRGFNGKCLPKDTNALVHFAWEKGLGVQLLATMIEVNKKFLNKNQS